MSEKKPIASPALFKQISDWFMTLPHCQVLGFKFGDAHYGCMTVCLPFKDELIGNPATRVIHGGVVTSLVDSTSAGAIYTMLTELEAIATLDLRLDYLRPAKPDFPIYCTAECYKLTKQIAFTRATAYQDDINDPVAYSVGTFMRNSVREVQS
jgi:uncharacterized protein (TIGR00369 family)